MTPIHKWAPDGKVLILKAINPDGTSRGGFSWPKSGPVEALLWSKKPTCESGGLFGWPWGVGIGDGYVPEYDDRWVIFTADPQDVVRIRRKVKVPRGEVIYSGDFVGAMERLLPGLRAWYAAHKNVVRRLHHTRLRRHRMPMPQVAVTTADSGWCPAAPGTLAVNMASASAAVGHVAVNTGYGGMAFAYPGASQALATGMCGLAAGHYVVRTTDKLSLAAATRPAETVRATGPRSVACALSGAALIETGEDGVSVLFSRYGRWVPQPWSILVQRWPDPVTHGMQVAIFHADAYPDAYGQEVVIEAGTLSFRGRCFEGRINTWKHALV